MKVKEAVEKFFSPAMKEDFEYALDIVLEDEDFDDGTERTYTDREAFVYVADILDSDSGPKLRTMQTRLLRAEIALGLFEPMTNEQYENAQVLGGRKSSVYPELDGQRYRSCMTYDKFMESGKD